MRDSLKLAVEKGIILASPEEAKRRYSICWDCEHLFKQQNPNGIIPCICRKCGCAMKTKTRVAGAQCPLPEPEKKWKAVS